MLLPYPPHSTPFIRDLYYNQQQQAQVVWNNVSKPQLNSYYQVLEKISSSLSQEQVRELCSLSQEAEHEGVCQRDNLDGLMLFNFFEQQMLIAPYNLEYLRVLLLKIGRMNLCNCIEQYTGKHLNGQPMPLHNPIISSFQFPAGILKHLIHNCFIKYSCKFNILLAPLPPVDSSQQYHETCYFPMAAQAPTSKLHEDHHLSTPTAALDEDTGPARLALPAKNQVNYLYEP